MLLTHSAIKVGSNCRKLYGYVDSCGKCGKPILWFWRSRNRTLFYALADLDTRQMPPVGIDLDCLFSLFESPLLSFSHLFSFTLSVSLLYRVLDPLISLFVYLLFLQIQTSFSPLSVLLSHMSPI